MTAHRYYQLSISAVNGDASGYCAISEVILAEEKGGTNRTSGATVTSSSTAFSSPAGNVKDASRTTFWHSNTSPTPHTLTFDFGAGSSYDIRELRIVNRSNQNATAPKDFKLRSSDDGVAWTDEIVVSGATVWTWPLSNVYHAAGCPDTLAGSLFYRIAITAAADPTKNGVSGSELQLRSSVGGPDFTTSSTFIVASSSFASGPSVLFDNNSSTVWSSNSTQVADLVIELPTAIPVVEVAWTARTDLPGQAPKTATVAGSDNRSSWTDLFAWSGQIDWTAGETRLFSGPPLTPRRRQAVIVT